MKKTFAFIIAIFAVLSGHTVAQTSCDALVANGVFDTQSSSVSEDRRLDFVNWARDRRESMNSNSGGGNIDISVPGYGDLKLGGNAENARQFWQDIENYDSGNTSQRTRVTGYVQKASEVIAKAFNDCINSSGLHVWIETNRNPRVFIVAAKFRSPGVPPQAVIENVSFSPSSLECAKIIQKGTEITGSTKRMLCIRNTDDAVTIVVNANSDPIGGGQLSLPAIRRPLTLAQKINRGLPFKVWFNRTNVPFGTIYPNVILTGRHTDGVFEVSGPNGPSGTEVTAFYGCGPTVPSAQRGDCFSPLNGFLNIWGDVFIFDSGGLLYTRDRRLVGSVWVP
jgi:hypothetical protein